MLSPHVKLFWKNRPGISLRASFSVWFLKKNVSVVIFYELTRFHCLVAFTLLGNMCIAIICKSGCDVMNFEVNFIFLIKLFSYMTKKTWQKRKYLENEKSFLDEIKTNFHHFWRALNEANNNFFERWESEFKYVFDEKEIVDSNFVNSVVEWSCS